YIDTTAGSTAAAVMPIRNAAFATAGITELVNQEGDVFKMTASDGTDAMLSVHAIRVTGDWVMKVRGRSAGNSLVKFNGVSLGKMIKDLAWTSNSASGASEESRIYALFVGPELNTQMVYKSDGSFLQNSRVSMKPIEKSAKAVGYNYPVAFFRMTKSSAHLLGVLNIADAGTSFVE
ncbi:MAG: hypothetical protein ACRC37_01075, partial [Lentisphaeria bacterium]